MPNRYSLQPNVKLQASLYTRPFLKFLLVTIFLVFNHFGNVHADTFYLKNGNTLDGKVVEEKDGLIRISTGSSEVTIPASQIERIEKGYSVDYFTEQLDRRIEDVQGYIKRDLPDRARRNIESILLDIENEIQSLDNPPAVLEEKKSFLEELRHSLIPPDPISKRAEELFQQALERLDHIDYTAATELLKQARELKPERTDVLYQLGEVAQKTGNVELAANCYTDLLDIDAETYYADVSTDLVQLLDRQGRQYLKKRKSDEAVEVYKTFLMLKASGDELEPVDFSEFVSRRIAREEKKEEDILIEIYQYADDADLVDLAFASISQAVKLNPENEEYQKLEKEASFFSKLNQNLEQGNLSAAADLLTNADEDFLSSDEIQKRIDQMAGDLTNEIEAAQLLGDAESALGREDFETAQKKAEKIAEEYPEMELATRALEILKEAKREIPIKLALEDIDKLLKDRKFDEAQEKLDELNELEEIELSRYEGKIQSLNQTLPLEREADGILVLAKMHLDNDEFEEALEKLETLETDFRDTEAGSFASKWLTDYRRKLAREARKNRLFQDNAFFSLASPALWKAASSPAAGGSRLQPIENDEVRSAAWGRLRQLQEKDMIGRTETRSYTLYIILPILIGSMLAFIVYWIYARPGKGKYSELDDQIRSDSSTGVPMLGYTGEKSLCKMCGEKVNEDDLTCQRCGATTQLSELEQERKDSKEKMADYDPWDIRTKAKTANDFEIHFEKAKELSETSDVEAAIEEAKKALHEDVHQKQGYILLADLYERSNKQDEANKCYREVLLLDPTDVVARQKVESHLGLVDQPIIATNLIVVLSISFWWMLFWLVLGLETFMWPVRVALAILGCVLTIFAWKKYQSAKKVEVLATNRGEPDVHRPLPTTRLTFREQARQARVISSAIKEHTGIDVPTLTPWRPIGALLLSITFLVILVLLAWQQKNYLVLLAWPAGCILFAYLLEIHPRVYTAHVILRHVFEETISPWVDPHRPFEPKGKKCEGEFLIESPGELPVNWALSPYPFGSDRQAVLNSLQQTLNRHWSCHRFYENLHMVRDVEMPFPAGFKSLQFSSLCLIALGLCLTITIGYLNVKHENDYVDSINKAYGYFLQGDVDEARDYFVEASHLFHDRALPYLYLGHLEAAIEHSQSAERAFESASKNTIELIEVYNDYGNYLQREGRFDNALEQYQIALEKDPRNPDILSNAGSAAFKSGNFEQAVSFLRQAVSQEPEHQRAHTTLGLALEELGMINSAKDSYANAISVAPDLEYTQVARDRLEELEEDSVDQPLTLEISLVNASQRQEMQ